MSLLALDLGTSLGWALDGETIVHGTTRLDGSCTAEKMHAFRMALSQLLSVGEPWTIYYERPHAHGGFARDIVYGQQGILLARCWPDIPAHRVPANTLKKWATGSGRAGKLAMLAMAHTIAGRQDCKLAGNTVTKPPFCECELGATMGMDAADATCLLGYGRAMEAKRG